MWFKNKKVSMFSVNDKYGTCRVEENAFLPPVI